MLFSISGIIGLPFTIYSYLVTIGWAGTSASYIIFFSRFNIIGVNARAVDLTVVLSLEMLFFALFLGIYGLLLFIIILFATGALLKLRIKGTRL